MNIIVLHGDHLTGSAKRLQKFIDVAKGRGWDIVHIEEGDSLPESLTRETLFQTDSLFVLEKPTSRKRDDFSWLNKKAEALKQNLVIYYPDTLKKDFLHILPKGTKIEEFKLPENIFIFLDSFYPANFKKSLKIFHSVLSNEPIEFIFSLLTRHLRDLYLAKLAPEKLWYQPWRVSKLKKQASFFSSDKLKDLISELARMDMAAKTSKGTLTDSLDLMIATKLE